MKHLLLTALTVLLISGLALAQGSSKGTTLMSGTGQSVSGMQGGPHDFTTSTATDSLNSNGTKILAAGPTNFLCGYCHVPHITSTGVTGPLWARKSLSSHSSTFGTYTSSTMTATASDVKADDNYSSFCLSCHDGSLMFAKSAYTSRPTPNSFAWGDSSGASDFYNIKFGTTSAQQSYMNMSTTGTYGGLSHIHPVNITYTVGDPGLQVLAQPTYAYWDATYGAVGRVFNGKVQCSSCHNPHNNVNAWDDLHQGNVPLIEGTLDGGKLCIACHKK